MKTLPSFRHRPFLAVLAGLAILAAPGLASAQDVPSRESAVEMRKQFMADLDTMYSKFTALAEAIPAEKYSWRPAEGVRSIGEAFQHVSSEFYVFTPMSYGATASPAVTRSREGFQKFEAMSTKPDVLKHLKESFAYTKQAIMGLDDAAITGQRKLFGQDMTIMHTSLIMSGDLHEHLGQLIAYARMNGVKPPWSK